MKFPHLLKGRYRDDIPLVSIDVIFMRFASVILNGVKELPLPNEKIEPGLTRFPHLLKGRYRDDRPLVSIDEIFMRFATCHG